MRIIEQLAYKITSDTSQFDKGIQTSEKNVSKFSKVASMALTALSVGAIAGVTKKILSMAQSSATALDRVDKMSQKINISRQSFQEWDFILSQSGASVDGLQMSVKTLANAASGARDGTKEYSDEFDRLRISATDTNGNLKDSETLFNEVFLALSDMKDETQRTATASKLLGRSATELAPAMNAGADSIENMRNQAHDLGLVMSDDAVDAGVALTDSIDQLKRSFKAFSSEALLPVINLMNGAIQLFLNQETASSNLEGALDDLKEAQDNYNKVVRDGKTDTDELTGSMIDQAIAAKQLALQKLEEVYFSARDELEKYNKQIDKSSEINKRNTEVLNSLANKYGTTREGLALLAHQEQLSASDRDLYNDSVDAVNESYSDYIEAVNKSAKAEQDRKRFVDAMTSAYLEDSSVLDRFIDIDKEFYDQVVKNAQAIKNRTSETSNNTDELIREKDELRESTEATEENTEAIDEETEATRRLTLARWEAQQALTGADDARERALANSGELSNSYKKEVDGLKAVTEWLLKYQEEISNSTQAVNMLSSIWDNLNEAQANANEAELQRMKEAGASEEELNEKKREFAQEESQRQKAQASFQAIIDTASAVIGFLANPGGLAGVGLSALAVGVGASQIAAINSAPIPSYAVGTIDVPSDRVAQLHAGETVLTKGITEEAKTQGITIAPTGQVSGTPAQIVIQLDGREIARSSVIHVNSGQVGTIKTRVVK